MRSYITSLKLCCVVVLVLSINAAASKPVKVTKQGQKVKLFRNFIMVEGTQPTGYTQSSENTTDGDTGIDGIFYAYGENPDDYSIPVGNWAASPIDFTGWPANLIVTKIDVYYKIYPSYPGTIMWVDLTGDDTGNAYTLIPGWTTDGTISETDYNITYFSGEPLNQLWVLWAYEEYGTGGGYIGRWWIKVYYDSGSDYCTAVSLNPNENFEYISNVQVGTINNSSSFSAYSDFTGISTSMEPETGYPITITTTEPWETDECGIWVDWNQDIDFDDDGEEIAIISNPGSGIYATIVTPPADAVLGDTRMRIVLSDTDENVGGPAVACGSVSYGEVEDYTITVAEAGPAYGGGTGTPADPYLIFTEEHLQTLGETPQHWDKDFKLRADLDLSGYTGEEFNIIGDCSQGDFTGNFDGNDHYVYNFTYETTDNDSIGLFGCASASFITDLAMIDPKIDADNADSVSALVGTALTVTIERCSVEGGWIDGENSNGLGSLVGRGQTVFLYDSFSTTTVKANDEYGGLAGELTNSAVRRCFAAGYVAPSYGFPIYRGAMIGKGQMVIHSDCFWDTEVCGTSSSVIGTGKTTLEMYRQSTYTGWDFENVWKVCKGANYPMQVWRTIVLGDFTCSNGIEISDLDFMCNQWLLNKVNFDIAPTGGDWLVDWSDWAVFAAAYNSNSGSANWNPDCDVAPQGGDQKVDARDAAVFVSEWLVAGDTQLFADIYPQPNGDGIVNIRDYALFTLQWMSQ